MALGKRKKSSRKPAGKKKREPLGSTFQCVFCNHESAVQVKLDKKGGVGNLSCKVCGQHYQTGINHLSAPVDVYAAWMDACEEVAKEATSAGAQYTSTADDYMPEARSAAPPKVGLGASQKEDDLDGFIDNDDDDVEAGYGDDE
ncbi:Elf1-domain-containing protein [Eremomyces bilateralis CBS 781.70]|uniref:Transcription elongation factor 1 homolog n=1 Tax=Eremomyces bilateralis CBS 781.70 TaxID=1392243 RepID=A0A6G1G6B2_9PEZI|nr:Elf1-domain-containing protein [Eremomyces bilateralis CBS 781.70]KAF1813491.1 Elf1-domain-containing protein [Eremomyces bilateralis CBS 781.70]